MKRKTSVLVTTVLLAGISMLSLTACGGEYNEIFGSGTSVSGGSVSGSAVSGAAVSGQAVSGSAVTGAAVEEDKTIKKNDDMPDGQVEQDVTENIESESTAEITNKKLRLATETRATKYRFSNTTNFYMEKEDFEGFVQYTLDGRKQKEFQVKGFEDLVYVDEESVYYVKREKSDKIWENPHSIYQIPIGKQSDGTDKLLMKRQKKLLGEKEEIDTFPLVLINEQYVVYNTFGEYVEYDKKKKTKLSLEGKPDTSWGFCMGNCGDKIFLMDDSDSSPNYPLYCHTINSDEWTFLYNLGSEDKAWTFEEGDVVYDERYFVFADVPKGEKNPQKIFAYDAEKGSLVSVATDKELWNMLYPGKEWTNNLIISQFHLYNNRVYMQVVEKEKKELTYKVISADLRTGAELKYEKELTNCLKKNHTAVLKGEDGKYVLKSGKYIYQIAGKLYMLYNDKVTGEIQVGYYNLLTDEFRKVKKSDKEYYEPYYNSQGVYLAGRNFLFPNW